MPDHPWLFLGLRPANANKHARLKKDSRRVAEGGCLKGGRHSLEADKGITLHSITSVSPIRGRRFLPLMNPFLVGIREDISVLSLFYPTPQNLSQVPLSQREIRVL
jgi:hypothetical protein